MKRFKFLVLVLAACGIGVPLFAGGQRGQSGTTPGGGASPAPTGAIQMKNGWPQQWYDTPTAAQAGIRSFSEAPALAELVKAGKLPPVEQRIPTEDALVIQSLDGNAKYGGTLRGARLGVTDWGDGARAQIGYMFRCDPTSSELIPYVAKGYSINTASDTFTMYLRRGARWSDGHPLTADDVVFPYEEIYTNPDLATFSGGSYPGGFIFNGKRTAFRKIDDYTVEIKFPIPLSRKKIVSLFNHQYHITPAHHAKLFLPKYNPQADANAKAEGFTTWQLAFSDHMNMFPGRRYPMPELGPWVMSQVTDRGAAYERNPYFIAVDEKGRQLPYIDNFVTRNYTDSQVAILDAMQGNVDFIGRMLDPANLPIYKENEARGNYTTYEWYSTKMSQIALHFNLTYTDRVLTSLMRDVRFRRALSLAINRDEINQLVFLGLGKAQQFTINQSASFYRQGWDQLYAKYDPAAAKKLLADMGLKSGRDGYLLRPDGSPLELTLIVSNESLVGPIGQKITELTAQYWGEIGVRCIVKQQEASLFTQSMTNGDLSVFIFPSEDDIEGRSLGGKWSYGGANPKKPLGYAPEWGKWFTHEDWIANGKVGAEPPAGEEPPAEIKAHYANYLRYYSASNDSEYLEYAQKFWDYLMDQIPTIGTVGNTPAPVMVTNRIKNVLPLIPFSFESFLWQTPTVYQWYFTDAR
jgi:peptide/nickel transport system substrate-binding protein